jgi:hypothetical protein
MPMPAATSVSMKHARVISTLAIATMGSFGCTLVRATDSLPPRAAFDFHCPVEQLVVTPIDGACGAAHYPGDTCTAGVSGCGKQATYIFIWKANPQSIGPTTAPGQWVMNNSSNVAPSTP